MKFLYTRGAAAVAILPPEFPVGSLFTSWTFRREPTVRTKNFSIAGQKASNLRRVKRERQSRPQLSVSQIAIIIVLYAARDLRRVPRQNSARACAITAAPAPSPTPASAYCRLD